MVKDVRKAFPKSVAYTLKGAGSSTTITAVFDSAYELTILNSEGVPVNTIQPVLSVRDADLSRAPIIGDTCVIDTISYTIFDVQPDGSGMTRCMLTRD